MVRLSAVVCVVLVSLASASALAADPWWVPDPGADTHFEGDEKRQLVVDDRGCQGAACDFEIDVGPISANRSFCPHCRFAVFTLDPGLDTEALKLLGFAGKQIPNVTALIATLDDLLDTKPEELQPDLSGEDLEAFVDSVMEAKDKVLAMKKKLTTIADVTKNLGGFDYSTLDFDVLAEEIGARHDSAFQADFNNPNDPKKNNSGLRVYSISELLEAMVEQKVPESLQKAAKSLLSSLPGLPGTFEMSGDDEDPLTPATYHGVKTGLTIQQRTYTVSGNNVALFVFTIVNTTGRIVPLLEAGFLADFDVPPLSYDKETTFDAASQAVLVYDEHPYEDPPSHMWFGIAPVVLTGVGPAAPVLANWNIDKNMSLTQVASSIETNRLKFFLWHPDVSGDHDDAVGKSEKQGAVSVLFPGILLPGESRAAAFCMAQGSAGSKGAARAALEAKMTACKGLYAALTPVCGNATLELGEGCDDGNIANGDGCSEACGLETCGDELVVGGEECDDGNSDSDDGCSATCKIEKCGDGIVQKGEECDDGNLSNGDGCLVGCKAAACGDGSLRVCDPAVESCEGSCGDSPWCLSGSVAFGDVPLEINGKPASGALVGLQDETLTLRMGFDVVSDSVVEDFFYGKVRRVVTGPVSVSFEGPVTLSMELIASLTGRPWELTLRKSEGNTIITSGLLMGPEGADEQLSLELGGLFVGPGLGADGVPLFGPGTFTVAMYVRKHGEQGGTMTDFADGQGTGAISAFVAPVGVEQCDDGNGNDYDACTAACRDAFCGDGLVQPVLGEQCDPGKLDGPLCTGGCDLVNIAECGDGDVDPGEQCDDGNVVADDGCSAACLVESCGDGVVQAGEGCDDGNQGTDDGCTPACVVEVCGDGVVQQSEECDLGEANGDDAECLPGCVAAACGDGLVWAGEECDDGGTVGGDGCNSSCVKEKCGDGAPGPGEECDDGGLVEGDGCSPTCALEFCGDGAPGPGEECDDGNPKAGDGCNKDCLLEDKASCGNGAVGPGEQCDDGGVEGGDGCSELCQLEDPAGCGDGVVGPGEQCDDGNAVAGDGCAPTCATEKCGDKVQQPGEQCDDGDVESGDGCSAVCQLEPSECGDGVQQPGEQCDDGGVEVGDGCDAGCQVEGEVTTLLETCGNGALEAGEQCDDGGHWEGDGCDSVCQLEAKVCGNGAREPGESCDDGGLEPGDGCDELCKVEAECGNGTVETGESCDDGGVEPGDGCNEACKKEFCGDYVVQGSEECDEGDLNSDVKPDACRKDCAAASCGDGVEDTGECDEATFCGSDCKSVAEPGVAEPELDAGAQDTAGAEDAAQAETAEEGPESSGGCGGCEAGEGRGGLPGAALLLAAALVLAASRGRRKSEESGRCGGPECRNLLN